MMSFIRSAHTVVWLRCMAVVAGDAAVQDQMSKCPFVQHKMNTESGREDALDLAFTAQAVLQGIVSPHRRK